MELVYLSFLIFLITSHCCDGVIEVPSSLYNEGYQNKRLGSLFKDTARSKPHFLDAVVWKGERPHDTFTGSVYLDNTYKTLLSSSMHVNKFPFTPETFFIDVVDNTIPKKEAERRSKSEDLHYIESSDGECTVYSLRNPSDMDKVYEVYSPKKQ